LEQEEDHVRTCLEGLRELRTALLHGGRAALTGVLARQESLAQQSANLRSRRLPLFDALSNLLDVPVSALRVSVLAERAPGNIGVRLNQCRDRLHHLTAELDGLNRGNASIVHACLDFLGPIVEGATGETAASNRYSSAGLREDRTWGSIVSTRG
jgi:hypothetical protein